MRRVNGEIGKIKKSMMKIQTFPGIVAGLHEKSSVLQDCPGKRVRIPIDRFRISAYNISGKSPDFFSRKIE